ncbi:MAG: 16S rRNA (adenine(1518)-N(6)/adenine(1519)-N(6))-dimethyltransferase RsmA [Micrococcales bacterium]|nr:16S rRNA (adenine(1518)-N(6)/adenine(1519)-N(6))-dimethyltransferase RsmA [Micrococcales bacterium]
MAPAATLGPVQIRELADRLSIRPTKQWGQNFVIDANTVRRIVRLAGVGPLDDVLEVGPGLGSLTLPLLGAARSVTAVEIDPTLAAQLPLTVAAYAPERADSLYVLPADALALTQTPVPPTALVANLPYNVSVPVLLTLLARFETIERVLVMVQLEVAQRLAAGPGSKTYGVPSLKAAWYADVRLVGTVPRSVFWPVPNVDSGLVALTRRAPPPGADRGRTFACVDAAFAQRRKSLRAALSGWAGGPDRAQAALQEAGIDPRTRGEQLTIADFARLATGGQSLLRASAPTDVRPPAPQLPAEPD